jgi:hypothetical protein
LHSRVTTWLRSWERTLVATWCWCWQRLCSNPTVRSNDRGRGCRLWLRVLRRRVIRVHLVKIRWPLLRTWSARLLEPSTFTKVSKTVGVHTPALRYLFWSLLRELLSPRFDRIDLVTDATKLLPILAALWLTIPSKIPLRCLISITTLSALTPFGSA